MVNASQDLFRDDEEEQRTGRPSDDELEKLRRITGIGPEAESAMEDQAAAGAKEDNAGQEDPSGASAGDVPGSAPPGKGGLAAAEGLAGAAGVGGAQGEHPINFNPGDAATPEGRVKMALRVASRHKKPLIIGGGITIGTGTFIGIIFFLLIPLKVEYMVQNLEDHFFSAPEQAIEEETSNLFSDYVKSAIIPSLSKCAARSTLDKNCNPSPNSFIVTNPVSHLYKAWSNQRLENTLARDYGIEFMYEKHTGKYYMKGPGLSGGKNGVDITGHIYDAGNLFTEVSKYGGFKASLNTALEQKTSWKRVWYRYKVGRLFEEKYGGKRCITDLGCKISKTVHTPVDKATHTAKAVIAERVLMPRSQLLGTVFSCVFIDSGPCDSPPTSEPCTPGQDCELNGQPENDADRDMRSKVDQLVARFADDDAFKIYKDIQDSGNLSNYFIKQVVGNVVGHFADEAAGQAAGQQVVDALPVIGWINLAAKFIAQAHNIGPTVKKLAYAVNSISMIQTYMTYRTYADEIHTGNVTAAQVGSFNDSLGPDATSDKGGAGSAEQSPLYQSMYGSGYDSSANQTASLIDDLLPSKALADSTHGTSTTEKCDNGKPQTGKLCGEEKVAGGNSIANGITDFLNQPGMGILTDAADVWNSSAGKIVGIIGSAVGLITQHISGVADFALQHAVPGYTQLKSEVSDLAGKLMDGAVNQLIPNPFSDNMGGHRTFDMMAGGADALGNITSQDLTGGEALTPQQSADIINQQQSEAQQRFDNQPLFARMFSTDSQYSLLSKVALAMPSGNANTVQSFFGSLFSDPFGKLFSGFSSIFSTNKAFAGALPQADPFGYTPIGYPAGTIPPHPKAYWDQNCTDDPSTAYQKDNSWNAATASNINQDTEQPTPSSVNPCLLIMATTGSDGGVADTSLLTQDDTADLGNGNASTGTSSTADASINTDDLYKDSTSVACADGTNDIGNYDGYYQGNKVPVKLCAVPNLPSTGEESNGGYGVKGANGNAVVNSRVSGAVLAMVQAADKDGVKLTAISSYRSMAHQQALCPCDGVRVARPGYSNHQMGLAIDFGGGLPSTPGPISGNQFWGWLSKNASNYGYQNYPAEAWHWSPDGH